MTRGKLEIQSCPACGAPLEGEGELLTCAYCGQPVRRDLPPPAVIEITINNSQVVHTGASGTKRSRPAGWTERYINLFGRQVKLIHLAAAGLGVFFLGILFWMGWRYFFHIPFTRYKEMAVAAGSPDGDWLISAHGLSGAHYGAFYVWNARTGGLERKIELGKGVVPVQAHWSRDGKSVLLLLNNGKLAAWDTSTWAEGAAVDLENATDGLVWSPDEQALASLDRLGFLRVWDAQTGKLKFKFEAPMQYAMNLDWAPDSGRLAVGGDDSRVRILDAGTGTLLGEYLNTEVISSTLLFSSSLALQPQEFVVWGMDWAPDGRYIAVASQSGHIFILDGQNAEVKFVLEGHREEVRSVAWSPDGAWLASVGDDYSMRIWNTESRQTEQAFNTGYHPYQLAWSPDSQSVIVSAGYGVSLVDVQGHASRLKGEGGSYGDTQIMGWAVDRCCFSTRKAYAGILEVWECGVGRSARIALPFWEVLWSLRSF